jgi:cytochrome c553
MIPIAFMLSLVLLPGAARAEEAVAKKIEPNPAAGEKLIQRFCVYCHSEAAVKRGNLKPWHELVEPLTEEEFHERVVKGVPPVMPGFPELAPLHTASMYAHLKEVAAPRRPRVTRARVRTDPPGPRWRRLTVPRGGLRSN